MAVEAAREVQRPLEETTSRFTSSLPLTEKGSSQNRK